MHLLNPKTLALREIKGGFVDAGSADSFTSGKLHQVQMELDSRSHAPFASRSSAWPEPSMVHCAEDEVRKMRDGAATDAVHVLASAYRICPLGAHIDHQGGSVTAMAINRGVTLAFCPSDGRMVTLRSGQFGGTVQFSLDYVPPRRNCSSAMSTMAMPGELSSAEECRWGDYARGAVVALQNKGHRLERGMVGYLHGSRGLDGGGLSSSAAVGVAFLLAFEHVNGLHLSEQENVELDRIIENEYLGLRIGVLDQSAVLLSRRDCLSLIHCKDRTYQIIKPPWYQSSTSSLVEGSKFKILIAFSGLRHALASRPGYNTRVNECQEAAKALLRALGRDSSDNLLSNVTAEEYKLHEGVLSGDPAKRAKHFFTENARVLAGIEAWSSGDLARFGRLISESGQSSIENYECGCEPLIQLRQILLDAPGVLGARFSGAGFRGCCVALVLSDQAEEAAKYVEDCYRKVQPELARNTVETPIAILCDSADGAHVMR